jgi:hypothetical protein
LASIIKKSNKYSTYYVIAESKRVDGKPRIVKQWYLGTIGKIIRMAEGHPDKNKPREIACQEDGAVRVLFGIAQELGLRDIINSHVRKRHQGMTPADYILIAALNRAAGATSKAKSADGRSTEESIRKTAQDIVDRYHVSGLLCVDVTEEETGYRVSARKNFPAIEEAKSRFGKQVLFTNRETMTRGEIIKTYIDRAVVESAFRVTKSDSWVKWGPAFHWTDSKIRVHALTCVIALLLVKIAHKRARQAGFQPGVERMMELLTGIKSALVYYPQSNKPHRTMCSLSEPGRDLLTKLGYNPQVRM